MNAYFKSAVPIWEKGKETEMNSRLQFKTVVGKLQNATIKIATSGVYNLFVNGKFICYGPARAGKNHFRMDDIDISNCFDKAENTVIIEVVGYNVNSFAIQNQPSFLQAEIIEKDIVVAFTGRDFTARKNPNYYRKVPRYSFQRAMTESYLYETTDDTFFIDTSKGNAILTETETKKIISRFAPYPKYKSIVSEPIASGVFNKAREKSDWRDRSCDINETLLGFKTDELDVSPAVECVNLTFSPSCNNIKKRLNENEYSVYKLPFETCGFLQFTVNCIKKSTIYVMFDEILTNDRNVNFLRMSCSNTMRFDLCKGVHNLRLFEVYSMQYIQFVVTEGECEIKNADLTEYKHPPVYIPEMKSKELQIIGIAAAENFCQNSVDLFMDCPSRERAGWLCDSFFTARAERKITGDSLIEKSFLENFLHEEQYEHLPVGMIPMCYPSDFYDGNFLPQWTLWLILQLKEYLLRSNDIQMINRFENKIHNLLLFFEQYENETGLLESLPGWNFIEWSKANDLVSGVSYPTNMLYSAALKAAGELYSNEAYCTKSQNVKQEVIKQSFNGEYFVDNAERKNGKLVLGKEISEVCQYYAFFMNVATKETHEELFSNLINNFGPKRINSEKTANIYPAAPFIGYVMRLEILEQNGLYDELADNIKAYFYNMAKKTGTLWEHAKTSASCCHGFASYVLCWLDKLSSKGY